MSKIATRAARGPLTIAAMAAPPPSDRERVVEIAEEMHEGLNQLQARHAREMADLRGAVADNALAIGRLTAGGGAVLGRGPAGVDRFNALLRARHGETGRQLDAAGFSGYRAALASYFRHGQNALDVADVRAALSVGSDPAGGYLVIDDRDPMPRERLFRTSPMRALTVPVPVSGGAFEGVHEVDDYDHEWVGESTTRSETSSGDLAAFRIPAEELSAKVPVTQRLLDDAAIDVGAYVESRIDRRFVRGENAAFVSGNGVMKPRGFLDYKTAAVTTADATRDWGVLQYVATGAAGDFPVVSGLSRAADVGALYDVRAALHAELRADAVWVMNSSTHAFIEKLKDEDGRSLVRQTLDSATPDRLLGHAIVVLEDMPDVASDAFAIAFGNFGVGYQIVEKPGIRVLRDPYTTQGKVLFKAYKRVGGDVVNFDAIKLLKFAAS